MVGDHTGILRAVVLFGIPRFCTIVFRTYKTCVAVNFGVVVRSEGSVPSNTAATREFENTPFVSGIFGVFGFEAF